ncbi:hypothetical protein KGM_213039 [Danaus plexippus plexippus]|uniref:Uncharacterized protein n=1 Tax=Danaus plexippus plexippus TaxID=278856 RepID=A0A212F376_DANPL|nr:hypothetical protein KGM_213039 [Danaus plexippus plexippus]
MCQQFIRYASVYQRQRERVVRRHLSFILYYLYCTLLLSHSQAEASSESVSEGGIKPLLRAPYANATPYSISRPPRATENSLDLTNGQLTPNNNTPLLAQALSVMNNYQAAAAGYGPPASPHTAGGRAGFPAASSPGPALDVYGSAADSVGYVQAASPQPSGFPAIAVSRAPLNYTPVASGVAARDNASITARRPSSARLYHRLQTASTHAAPRAFDGRLLRPTTARSDPSTAASQTHHTPPLPSLSLLPRHLI